MSSDVSKVYVGDVGTVLLLETGQSLVGATVSVSVPKPNSTIPVTWPGTIDGTRVRYVTQAGDFNVEGVYRLQAVVVKSSGAWRGDTAALTAYSAFK